MIKHIIWDFNGTLLDDVALALEVDNWIMAQIGMPPITMETYRALVRNPIRLFYEDLGVDLARTPFAWINRTFLDAFDVRVMETGLRAEALAVVAALAEQGLSQSVLSSSHEPTLRIQAKALGLTPYMRAVDGMHSDQGESKEQRGVEQLRALGVAPGDALLVGDTVTDAMVARHLGCGCVLVEGGHNSRARLEAEGVPVVRGLWDVYHTLGRRPGVRLKIKGRGACTRDTGRG